MIANMDKLKSIFEPQLIQEIQQFGIFQTFKEGDLIMDYGKYVRMMPIVLQGTVKVSRLDEKDNEILLYYLSSNESCSMAYSCCLEAKKSEVRAVAEDYVELIAIPHLKLDDWLCAYPSWKNYIMRSFNERFIELLKSIEKKMGKIKIKNIMRNSADVYKTHGNNKKILKFCALKKKDLANFDTELEKLISWYKIIEKQNLFK